MNVHAAPVAFSALGKRINLISPLQPLGGRTLAATTVGDPIRLKGIQDPVVRPAPTFNHIKKTEDITPFIRPDPASRPALQATSADAAKGGREVPSGRPEIIPGPTRQLQATSAEGTLIDNFLRPAGLSGNAPGGAAPDAKLVGRLVSLLA